MPTIHGRIEDVRSKLNSAYRDVQELSKLVDMLEYDDAPADTQAAIREVLDSLADINRAIVAADDPMESAIHHARKL